MTNIASIKQAITPIAKQYGISKVFLFGSYAKGTANENSDIDLLIEKGKPMSLLKLSGLRQECEAALNLSVDLVTTTGIAHEFQKEITGTEVLLYEE